MFMLKKERKKVILGRFNADFGRMEHTPPPPPTPHTTCLAVGVFSPVGVHVFEEKARDGIRTSPNWNPETITRMIPPRRINVPYLCERTSYVCFCRSLQNDDQTIFFHRTLALHYQHPVLPTPLTGAAMLDQSFMGNIVVRNHHQVAVLSKQPSVG